MSARDFEIYLIQTMSGRPELIDGALSHLQVSHNDAERIRQEVSSATQLEPGQIDRLIQILGDHATTTYGDDPAVGAVVQCSFSTWPGLVFRVIANRQGLWTDARFVRPSTTPQKKPTDPTELEPWKVTKEEISTWFGPLEQGDIWPPFEEYGLSFVDREGKQSTYDLIFSWGLLQSIAVTPL